MNANFVTTRQAELQQKAAACHEASAQIQQTYDHAAETASKVHDSDLIGLIAAISTNANDESRTRPLTTLMEGGYIDQPSVPRKSEGVIVSEDEAQLTRDKSLAQHSAFMHEFWRRALPVIDQNFGLGLIPKGEQQD